MMDHLSSQTIERYHLRELSLSETRALDLHLAGCENCRCRLLPPAVAWDALRRLQEGLQQATLEEEEHPTNDDFAALSLGRLDDIHRELIEEHLVTCASCGARWRELRRATPGWRERIESFFWKNRTLWQVASAATALALLILGLSYWLGGRKREEQIVVAPPSISPTAIPSVTSASPAPILLAFNDGGGRVTFDELGTLRGYDGVSPADRELVSQTLPTRRVETWPQIELAKPARSLGRGNDEKKVIGLIGPVGRVVLSDQPTLRWKELPEAETTYKVEIHDHELHEMVEASLTLTTTQWTPTNPLPRGRVYDWLVVASSQGKEIGTSFAGEEARFKVLEEKKVRKLARARQAYAGKHLVLGLLYARDGLLDDAERELEMLARANPTSSLPRDLLRSLRRPAQNSRR